MQYRRMGFYGLNNPTNSVRALKKIGLGFNPIRCMLSSTQENTRNLEALVLQDLLDCNEITTFTQLGLVDDTERSVANNFRICV